MHYKRQALHHLIVRALRRNSFTAGQPITVTVRGHVVILSGTVNHADLIPEAVVTAEAVAPFVMVISRLRIRGARVRA